MTQQKSDWRKKKKFADMEKELHLGTASDEEEEALIEEAEKARESVSSSRGSPTLKGNYQSKTSLSAPGNILQIRF